MRRQFRNGSASVGAAIVAVTILTTAALLRPAVAGDNTAPPPASATAVTTTRPATLRLVVTHTMESGRLVLKIEDRAILSAPLSALEGEDGRPRERDLSVPGGPVALTVQMLDGRGRIVGQGIIHRTVGAADPATLVVAEHSGTGTGLTLSWRTP